MKTAFLIPLSFVLAVAVPQAAVHAQTYRGPAITLPVPGVGPGPERHEEGRDDRERREHCAGLESREHELRERIQRVGYSEERQRLEFRLRETHEQLRDQCHR